MQGLSVNYKESQKEAANLFNLCLKLLHQLKLPVRGSKEDIELRAELKLTDEDAEFLAAWLGKLILFTATQPNSSRSPGLSAGDCEFLQLYGKADIWRPVMPGALNLTETKVVAAKFLLSGAFTEKERFMPALFASADTNSRLSDIGHNMLKRALPAVSLEDRDLIEELYSAYLGTTGDRSRAPVRPPLQGKILGLFCKSTVATTFFSRIVRIVKEGLSQQSPDASGPSDTSRQGLEASKLRGQVFNFTNWVARMSDTTAIAEIAPQLVGDLRNYIEQQGWPRIDDDLRGSASELSSRGYGYESIGLLAKAYPRELLLDPNLDLLRWFFRSLGGDASGKEISISIEQAMDSILGAFAKSLDPEIEEPLVNLLLHYTTVKVDDRDASDTLVIRSTLFMAVRFANRCLPYRNPHARWMDLVALSGGLGERNEVLEEGRKGLDPYWYKNLNPIEVLDESMDVAEVQEHPRYQMPEFDTVVDLTFGDQSGTDSLGQAYAAAVEFCRSLLLHQALTIGNQAPAVDVDWSKNLNALVKDDETTRETIKTYLFHRYGGQAKLQNPLSKLIGAAFTGFVTESLGNRANSGQCLLDLCALGPDEILDGQSARLSELQGSIFSNQHSIRSTSSRVFGLLASRTASPSTSKHAMLKQFSMAAQKWKEAVGSGVHGAHGSILAMAFYFSREALTSQAATMPVERNEFVELVLEILDEGKDKDIVESAIIAIGQLCLFGLLTPEKMPSGQTVSHLISRLTEEAKKGNENAVLCLGYLAVQSAEEESEGSSLKAIIKALYSLHEQRQPELQFAVGSALSCAAVCWDSKFLVGALDISTTLPKTAGRTITLKSILEKVLKDCKQTKPSLRQASVIWLLSLVQYCGHLEDIHGQLRSCQQAFKGFLSDRESLNQEAASRGLTLVYEKGDKNVKDDLIRDLVGSFTGTSSNLAGSVDPETQLFEAGAFPTDKGSVTTYKDIVTLASEVGDPSLVYRFMSLASNSAIWSSRAAFGRFGLSRILSDSSVDGYLAKNPKLYPVLYRYRFDPNTGVKAAMNDIWAALVKDSKATIDAHFDRILEDLLKNILAKEWRVRQACCAAIADLLPGRRLATYEKDLTRIWSLTFKVCDDIKESVRAAAMALARVLTGILTRSLEGGETSMSTANTMLKEVLPFLLGPSGLESSAKDVQTFALVTLLDIIKKASGKTLRPFIADLIGHLIALLSSVEPEAVNYLHLNADKYGMTQQQIDDARLSSVKTSPMMDAIERCLDMLDEQSMKDLEPVLANASKVVIGLPSKVGLSRVLVSLSTRHNFVFKPYADGFVRLLQKQLLDRNDTISTSAATACGYLSRVASDGEILKLVEYSKKLYFDSEDDRQRTISGEIVLAFANYATDRLVALASSVLPFAFLAMHDTYEPAKELFKAAWDDNVGGSRAVLLYLQEIISLCSTQFDSPRWSIKHASAFAIADVVTAAGPEISSTDAFVIWPALEKAMEGKTWNGKEKVLKAFISFAKNSRIMESDEAAASQMEVGSSSHPLCNC